MLHLPSPPPLSLYLHVPWCLVKCPYCDFNSHALRDDGPPEQAYVDALLADVEAELPLVWGRTVQTIFIGGGTPSLFSPAAFDRLLSGLRALLPIRPDAEITLEANPGTFEQAKFGEFRNIGINRLSIGVQSFDDAKLKALGRVHDSGEARRAAEIAHRAGFERLNLDLMFGLPGQDTAGALADLDAALALSPSHLSWYQLTIEPHTLFHHQPPVLPEDDALWAIQEAGQTRLAEAGFAQYETSAYARDNDRCRHNLNYWQFGDYLGIGAGAHGKLTDCAKGRILRRHKQRLPAAYLRGERLGGESVVAEEELLFEFMLNALRLIDGFDSALFSERTGLPLTAALPGLELAEARGLIERDHLRIRPTELGAQFLNDLLGLFLAEAA
jgi:oxygen-independent coproporphyrinogen-3 oxidase